MELMVVEIEVVRSGAAGPCLHLQLRFPFLTYKKSCIFPMIHSCGGATRLDCEKMSSRSGPGTSGALNRNHKAGLARVFACLVSQSRGPSRCKLQVPPTHAIRRHFAVSSPSQSRQNTQYMPKFSLTHSLHRISVDDKID